MENENGKLYYGTGLDNSQLRVGAAEAKRLLHGIGNTASSEGDKIDDSMKKIGKAVAGVFAVSQIKEFVSQVANVRGQFQQLEMAFKTMLGSAEKADALMQQLIKTAATTPFGVTDIAQGAKQLLAYGVQADKVNETLIRLGDIAAGLSIPLNDLAYLYGTSMVQGRLYTQDLNQFLARGIPLTDELAKQFGVTKDKVKDLVTEGKVGFTEVERAIVDLTSEGGRFGGLMEAQSQTITGQISNIEDSIEQMFNELGKKSEGVISDVLSLTSKAIENWESIGKVLLVVISTYGAYKAAVIAVAAAHKMAAIWGEVSAFLSLTKSITSAKDAMLLLNMATKANPIGLVLGVVAAAATAFGLFSDNTSKAAEMTSKYGEKATTAITRVESLSTALNGLTAGSSTHKKVMDELNGILEDYGIQTVKEGDSIDTVNEKRTQAIELIKQEAVERQRLNDIASGNDTYAKALEEAQNEMFQKLQGAETGGMFAGLVWSSDNSEIQENAAAISTIIAQQVEQNINLIAGKTGDEYQKGLNKIYANIQDKMRAIGISEKTITKAWWDDGFFTKTNIIQNYINNIQAAAEEHDRYTTAVNKSAAAEQAAADSSMTFADKVSAVERSLQKPTDGVHQLYENIKQLMSQYSENTIGFTIKFNGEVPAWMGKMGIGELTRLAKRFAAIGSSLKNGQVASVNGKAYTKQQALQRSAEYAQAAENKQTAADNKKKQNEAAAAENKKNAQARARRTAQAAEDRKREREQLAEEKAERNNQIAEYGQSVIEQTEKTELDIRQAKIDLMEEGYQKQKAQLDLNYDRLIAENKDRERQMLEALADKMVLQWENKHPKAKNSEKQAYRNSLLDEDSDSRLTRQDLTTDQRAQLESYEKIAADTRVKGNKEALNTMLQDSLTYEQQREKIAEEYQKKIENLYQHDKDGNRLKDENGNDKFNDGVSQSNVDELNYQQENALNAIDEQFAQREETYKAWCNEIANLTLEQLQALLTKAEEELKKVETDKKNGNASSQQVAVARAKVTTAKNNVAQAKAKADLNPDKRSIKQWQDLYKTLNEVNKSFEEIGDTIGGVAGDIIKTAGQISTSALTMINGIMQLTQHAATGVQGTATAASKAIQTVEKASVILTVISAALQIATQIVNLFNNDDKKQEEIEALQNRIDQLQWELDNADIVRIQEKSGKAIDLVKEKLKETRDEMLKDIETLTGFEALWARLTLKVSQNDELLKQSAEKIAAAYANVAYTADKALGGKKYSEAKEQLENIAQQQLLIQEQIDTENSKKKTDSDKIDEWEQKIEELGAKAISIINEMVEDIMGGTSSDIAEQLSDAFFEAFQNGEDYAKAWGDKVNEIIGDITKRLLVQKFLEEPLGEVFDKYKAQWFKDGKFMGIDAVLNSLSGLTNDLNQVGTDWITIWEALPQQIRDMITAAQDSTRETSSSGIANASQDSVDELNGRATAIQGHTYSISENTKLLLNTANLILQSVLNIESNTDGLSDRVASVESSVKEIKDTVNDIALKGIKIK